MTDTEKQVVIQAVARSANEALTAGQWGYAGRLVLAIDNLSMGKSMAAPEVLAVCKALGLTEPSDVTTPDANGKPRKYVMAHAPAHLNGKKHRGRPGVAQDVIKAMRKMRASGVPAVKVAKRFGLSHFTVYKYTKA